MREKLFVLLNEKFGVEPQNLSMECSLKSLMEDSLDWLSLRYEVEQEFSLQIRDEELVQFVTLQDLVNFLERVEFFRTRAKDGAPALTVTDATGSDCR